MGRYYPPDASNPPTFNTTHPLGARAHKSSQGILTVRFELPFAVWCQHCQPPAIVGQGVRFNAEKKRVGNYYSTPIWSFRMKHTACGGWWEIRTDPSKSEYVVCEGARRREYGAVEDDGAQGELKMLSEEERERRREDAFAGLEGRVEQKVLDQGHKRRVEELYEKSEVWRDPYDVNARLRRDFRVKRKAWNREERQKEGMQEKFSLGMDIVDETEGDRVRAKMVEFGTAAAANNSRPEEPWKPLFQSPQQQEDHTPPVTQLANSKKLTSEIAAEKSREALRKTLVGNTRAVIDPFLNTKERLAPPRASLGLLKRKRGNGAHEAVDDESSPAKQIETPTVTTQNPAKTIEPPTKNLASALLLVDYESD